MNSKFHQAALAYNQEMETIKHRLRSERRQFTVRVPEEERVSGRIYDYDSGVAMGLASDEMKKKHGFNKVFTMNISGCPHKLIIHP